MTDIVETNSSAERKPSPLNFDEDKNTKLHFSAAAGFTTDVQLLIQNGHKVDPENLLGWTPLMMAARNGHLETVQILLLNKADATKKNRSGMSTFSLAIASASKEIVQILLQHLLYGGVSKQSMESQISPISIAILYNLPELFHYLIEQNFDINAASPNRGITPIMYAAAEGNDDFYNVLVSKGADQQAKSEINQSAVDILHTKPNILFPQEQCLQHNVPQFVVMSPEPTFYNVPCPVPAYFPIRKSSDTYSPQNFFTPTLTPIAPIGFVPQTFFPPEFPTTPQFYAPQPMPPVYPNDFLNTRINPACMSPMPQFHYPSPAPNISPANWMGNFVQPKTPV